MMCHQTIIKKYHRLKYDLPYFVIQQAQSVPTKPSSYDYTRVQVVV